jgi:hypothetical protein
MPQTLDEIIKEHEDRKRKLQDEQIEKINKIRTQLAKKKDGVIAPNITAGVDKKTVSKLKQYSLNIDEDLGEINKTSDDIKYNLYTTKTDKKRFNIRKSLFFIISAFLLSCGGVGGVAAGYYITDIFLGYEISFDKTSLSGIDDSCVATLKRNNDLISSDFSYKIKDEGNSDYGSNYVIIGSDGKTFIMKNIPNKTTYISVEAFVKNKKVSENKISLLPFQTYSIKTLDPFTQKPRNYLMHKDDSLQLETKLNNENPLPETNITYDITPIAARTYVMISGNILTAINTTPEPINFYIDLFVNGNEIKDAQIQCSYVVSSQATTTILTGLSDSNGYLSHSTPNALLNTKLDTIDITNDVTYKLYDSSGTNPISPSDIEVNGNKLIAHTFPETGNENIVIKTFSGEKEFEDSEISIPWLKNSYSLIPYSDAAFTNEKSEFALNESGYLKFDIDGNLSDGSGYSFVSSVANITIDPSQLKFTVNSVSKNIQNAAISCYNGIYLVSQINITILPSATYHTFVYDTASLQQVDYLDATTISGSKTFGIKLMNNLENEVDEFATSINFTLSIEVSGVVITQAISGVNAMMTINTASIPKNTTSFNINAELSGEVVASIGFSIYQGMSQGVYDDKGMN